MPKIYRFGSLLYVNYRSFQNHFAENICIHDRWQRKNIVETKRTFLCALQFSTKWFIQCEFRTNECVCACVPCIPQMLFRLLFDSCSFSFLLFYYENNCIRTKWHNGNKMQRRRQTLQRWNAGTPSPLYQSDVGIQKTKCILAIQCNAMRERHVRSHVKRTQKHNNVRQKLGKRRKTKRKETEWMEKQNHKTELNCFLCYL